MNRTRLRVSLVAALIAFSAGILTQCFLVFYLERASPQLSIILVPSLIAALCISFLTGLGTWIALSPLGSLDKGSAIEPALSARIWKALRRVPWVFWISSAISLAVYSTIALGARRGIQSGLRFDEFHFILIIALELVVGALSAFEQISIADIQLLGVRHLLGRTKIDAGNRDTRLRTRLFNATWVPVLVAMFLASLAAIGFYDELANWTKGVANTTVAAPQSAATSTGDSSVPGVDTVGAASQDTETVGAGKDLSVFFTDEAIRNNELRVLWQLLVLIALIVLAALPMILGSVNAFERQIKGITADMNKIAEGSGNLDNVTSVLYADEVGAMAQEYNAVLARLSDMVRNVRGAGVRVSEAAGQTLGASKQASAAMEDVADSARYVSEAVSREIEVTRRSDEIIGNFESAIQAVGSEVRTQSEFVQESSSSISEIAANIESVANMASAAEDLSQVLSTVSGEGSTSVAEMKAAMKEIASAASSVEQFIGAISSIAAQTNILAMNAAIQAAHAGDAGMGFAVVASEVRSLALSSSQSAHEITGRIKDVITRISAGVRLADRSARSFETISAQVERNSELARTISRAMDEQRVGAQQTLDSIARLTEATEQIASRMSLQTESAGAMIAAINEIREATASIGTAVSVQTQSVAHVRAAIETVDRHSETSAHDARELGVLVEGFRVT